jgi:hypothetical protein
MGAALSGADDVCISDVFEFDWSASVAKDFTLWDVASGRNAYERIIKSKKLTPPLSLDDLFVKKCDFFTGFQDFGVLVNGGFLMLPLEVFKLFCEDEKQRVFVPLVLVAIVLFGGGSKDDRLKLLFDIFDLDGSGTFTTGNEMDCLVKTLFACIHSLGMITNEPDAEHYAAMCASFLAHMDIDNSGDIDRIEFTDWLMNRMSVKGKKTSWFSSAKTAFLCV